MAEDLIGSITHWYGQIGVAGIELTAPLSVGDTVHIVGNTSDVTQTIESMQVEHESVEKAKPGDPIAIEVGDRVRVHDRVFRVTEG